MYFWWHCRQWILTEDNKRQWKETERILIYLSRRHYLNLEKQHWGDIEWTIVCRKLIGYLADSIICVKIWVLNRNHSNRQTFFKTSSSELCSKVRRLTDASPTCIHGCIISMITAWIDLLVANIAIVYRCSLYIVFLCFVLFYIVFVVLFCWVFFCIWIKFFQPKNNTWLCLHIWWYSCSWVRKSVNDTFIIITENVLIRSYWLYFYVKQHCT